MEIKTKKPDGTPVTETVKDTEFDRYENAGGTPLSRVEARLGAGGGSSSGGGSGNSGSGGTGGGSGDSGYNFFTEDELEDMFKNP